MSTEETKTVKEWRSVAMWPIEAPVQHSDDLHYTEEEAMAVCRLLVRNGFGGDRKFFPIHTSVERVYSHPPTHQPATDTAREAAEPIETWNPLEHGIHGVPLMVPAHLHNDSTAALRREVKETTEERDSLRATIQSNRSLFDARTAERDEARREVEGLRAELDTEKAAYASADANYENVVMEKARLTAQLDAATKERDEARAELLSFRGTRLRVESIMAERDAALARAEAGEKRIEVMVEEWNAEHVSAAKANKRVQAATELLAKEIYDRERVADPEGKNYHWQNGGNSLKRDEARRKARAAIDAATGAAKGEAEGEKPATWTPQQTWIGGEGGDV